MRAAAGEDTTFLGPIAQSITPLCPHVEIGCDNRALSPASNMAEPSAHRPFLICFASRPLIILDKLLVNPRAPRSNIPRASAYIDP